MQFTEEQYEQWVRAVLRRPKELWDYVDDVGIYSEQERAFRTLLKSYKVGEKWAPTHPFNKIVPIFKNPSKWEVKVWEDKQIKEKYEYNIHDLFFGNEQFASYMRNKYEPFPDSPLDKLFKMNLEILQIWWEIVDEEYHLNAPLELRKKVENRVLWNDRKMEEFYRDQVRIDAEKKEELENWQKSILGKRQWEEKKEKEEEMRKSKIAFSNSRNYLSK